MFFFEFREICHSVTQNSHVVPRAFSTPDKMAANRPHFRNLFEELEVLRESVTQFSFGAPSLKILEKLRPLLSEATRIRMVRK